MGILLSPRDPACGELQELPSRGQHLHSPAGFRRVHRVLGARAAAPLALAAMVGVALIPWSNMHGLPRVAFALAGVALVGACVLREDHGLQQLLVQRPLARIGMVSYGIYLLHLVPNLGLVFARHRLPEIPSPVRFVVMLAGSWLLAELSFALLERPLLRLKERWR